MILSYFRSLLRDHSDPRCVPKGLFSMRDQAKMYMKLRQSLQIKGLISEAHIERPVHWVIL